MIGGLILAAGSGSRFGGAKQLAELDGTPLLRHGEVDSDLPANRFLVEKLDVFSPALDPRPQVKNQRNRRDLRPRRGASQESAAAMRAARHPLMVPRSLSVRRPPRHTYTLIGGESEERGSS